MTCREKNTNEYILFFCYIAVYFILDNMMNSWLQTFYNYDNFVLNFFKGHIL